MSVEITPFKETKEGENLNVNIRVFYKGCACKKVDELSGGEQARLELAICLAINSLGSGTLLLLDECFSSLDSETTDDIVELLKTHARESGKLIIVIAHQVSEGSFDHVTTL
jgi:ABC-type Mn2+/Zn2+ transport system ATPase subunit